MKRILSLVILALLTACSVMTTSPERQIVDGNNAIAATATVAGTLLRLEKITVTQAISYRGVLGTASAHLDVAAATLKVCRTKTVSTQTTVPDPCRPTVDSDIALGVSIGTEVAKTLNSK